MTNRRPACADPDIDPEIWFADRSTPEGIADTELAIAICRSCPLVKPCLEQAMREEGSATTRYRSGVRGGLTPDERRDRYEAGRPRPATVHRLPPAPPAQTATDLGKAS